jgi:FkbM family methyltransferase
MKKSLLYLNKVISWLVGFGYGTESIEKEIKSFKQFIPNGKIFVDVGGNKGLYSASLINNFDVDSIHVFEPCKLNIEVIEKKFVNNKKVIINSCGLSNINSNSILYSNDVGSGLASLSKRNLDHFGIKFDKEEKVILIRFDEYWKNNISSEYIDLLKIDVEGHELSVLEGVGELIKKIKVIQFEFGGCNIDTKTFFQDFWYYFKQNNFEIYRITPLGSLKISSYSESLERFQTSNYFCVNLNLY